MGYGIRVVLVMNRKGGSGKSTLCRALASAAAARGETVTIFDTDASKSCLKWMQAGKEAGNWSSLVEMIHTLDAHRVAEATGQIYEQPDQEHLILIDTFGGGSKAQDVLAVAAHRIICPMMLSRGDLSETMETANWYLKLRGRVEKPDELAGFSHAPMTPSLLGALLRLLRLARMPSPGNPTPPGAVARNEALRASRRFGRTIWRRWSGYHRGSSVDTKMHCATLLGQRLSARDYDRQVAEFQVREAVLNGFTALGNPETQAAG